MLSLCMALSLGLGGCSRSDAQSQPGPHMKYVTQLDARLSKIAARLPKQPEHKPCDDGAVRRHFEARARTLTLAEASYVVARNHAEPKPSEWAFLTAGSFRALSPHQELHDEAAALDVRAKWKRFIEQQRYLGLVRVDHRESPRLEGGKLMAGSLKGWLFIVDLANKEGQPLCQASVFASGSDQVAQRKGQTPLEAAWADLRLNVQRALDDALGQISEELTIAFD